MIEVWKDIPGYEGYYQVSNLGEVRSLPRYRIENGEKKYLLRGTILKQSNTTTGYKKVELQIDKNKKSYKVHRLVAMAFIVNTYGKPFVNHKDGNPKNNIVDNLEWCTQEENVNHARKTGLKVYIQDTIDHNKLIRDYLNFNAGYVCEKYKISKQVMYDILDKHDIKTHGNVKYSLDQESLLNDFKSGMRNIDIAKKYNCSRTLIGTRKHQFKKEGLL